MQPPLQRFQLAESCALPQATSTMETDQELPVSSVPHRLGTPRHPNRCVSEDSSSGRHQVSPATAATVTVTAVTVTGGGGPSSAMRLIHSGLSAKAEGRRVGKEASTDCVRDWMTSFEIPCC